MGLTLEAFAEGCRDTATYDGRKMQLGLLYCTLGLAGEAGEVAEKVKKMLRDDMGRLTQTRRLAIASEVGDVLWYALMLCDELGVSADDVAAGLLAKLADRKRRGVINGDGDRR